MIRGYITKRPNGLYVVTKFFPTLYKIQFTEHKDVYITYGDPVDFLNVNQEFVDSVYGNLEIDVLKPRRMWLVGRGPTTHWLLRQSNELYEIRHICNITNKIVNICPWFIEKMFRIKDLSLHQPKLIHFSGKLT